MSITSVEHEHLLSLLPDYARFTRCRHIIIVVGGTTLAARHYAMNNEWRIYGGGEH